jgi:hypothetical protein
VGVVGADEGAGPFVELGGSGFADGLSEHLGVRLLLRGQGGGWQGTVSVTG